MPGMLLPVRSTLISAMQRRLLLSPSSRLSETQLKALGDVSDIIAPSLLHSGGVEKARAVFPAAKVWGPPGARKFKREIRWTEEISPETWPYSRELPCLLIQGMPRMSELVFLHLESSTLIVSDLCFNLVEAQGLGAWIVLHLFGTYRRFGVSRLWLSYIKDREAFCRSLDTLFTFSFDTIVPGHGALVTGDAKQRLRRAFQERGYLK